MAVCVRSTGMEKYVEKWNDLYHSGHCVNEKMRATSPSPFFFRMTRTITLKLSKFKQVSAIATGSEARC